MNDDLCNCIIRMGYYCCRCDDRSLEKVINLEQLSNDMKPIIFWAVSPSRNFVHRLCTNDCIAANMAVRALRQMNDMPTDLALCTNECATNFRNGMVFNNGKLYKRV